jgi:hypothetical protein
VEASDHGLNYIALEAMWAASSMAWA